MPKALFITGLQPDLADEFVAQGPKDIDTVVVRHDIPLDEKISMIQDTEYLVLFRPNRIEDEVLKAAGGLKLIQLVSAGFEHMNLDLCREFGLPVANNGGTNSIDVAEHTFALLLGAYRRLVELDADVRSNRWSNLETGECTYTIHNKTVGIIGLGHIGRQVAERLKPFGPRMVYSDVAEAPPNVEENLGVEYLQLDSLLEQADIVTLHVPINDATRNLIDARALSLMKPTAVLVNTCRGGVIDEPALVSALQSGEIAFAALDVLAQEPPDRRNQILNLPNVLLTPHTAGITRDTWARRGVFVYENIDRVRKGEAPLSRVDGF